MSFLNKQELVFGMSSGLDLRKRIVRKDPPKQGGKGKLNPSPLSAIDAGSPGEVRIANDHMYALAHLYHASPSIQAARTILLGQLLRPASWWITPKNVGPPDAL